MKNKKAPARHKAGESYLLTTKLYCGKCGALMFVESGVSHTGKMQNRKNTTHSIFLIPLQAAAC